MLEISYHFPFCKYAEIKWNSNIWCVLLVFVPLPNWNRQTHSGWVSDGEANQVAKLWNYVTWHPKKRTLPAYNSLDSWTLFTIGWEVNTIAQLLIWLKMMSPFGYTGGNGYELSMAPQFSILPMLELVVFVWLHGLVRFHSWSLNPTIPLEGFWLIFCWRHTSGPK